MATGNGVSWAAIDEAAAAAVAQGAAVGLSLAVVDGGRLAFARGYGRTANDGEGAAVSAETRFAYGSICKTICATMVMRLVEQGRLALNRPLTESLPRLRFGDEAYGGRVTLRHVLSHTSGLPAAGREFGPRGEGTLRTLIEAEMPHYRFLAAPGAHHLYSNTAFCLAGYAAEAATGEGYDDLVQTLVLEPLGMGQTTFDPARVARELLALPHEGEELQPTRRLAVNDAGHPSSFAYGTASDLARLAILHLEGGQWRGQRLLAEGSVREMQRPQTSRFVEGASHPLAHVSAGYGLGIMTGDYYGHRVLRHGGMAQSYNCFFELLPELGRGFVLLTNGGEDGPLMALVMRLYDELVGWAAEESGGLLPAPPVFEDARERQLWATYEGEYLNVEWGGLLTVRAGSDDLLLIDEGVEQRLTCIGRGRYFVQMAGGRRAPLAFAGEGEVAAPFLVYAGAPYHRWQAAGRAPDAAALLPYVGVYRDPYNFGEGEMMRLLVEDGALWVQEGEGERMACEALGELAFRCDGGFFELGAAADGGRPALLWGKATRYRRV